jgi:hypothetical protein
MAGAVGLVLPLPSEGFGRAALEAMATGDEATLAEKIRWIFDHRGQARVMG